MARDILFEPVSVQGLTLRNRIVMAPMVTNMGIDSNRALRYYQRRARGGVGLVMIEACHINRFSSRSFVEGLQRLAYAIRQEGAAVGVQLFTDGTLRSGEKVYPSDQLEGRGISTEEIRLLVMAFAAAAQTAWHAGVDLVEIHGAHDFFLNRFLSPIYNRRGDIYGGTPQKRMTLALEIVSSVRDALDSQLPVFFRHTPVEPRDGGYTLSDTLEFAFHLQGAGAAAIDVSPSCDGGGDHACYARAVRERVDVPVVAVGRMDDPDTAESVVAEGKADLVAIGRGLLADPDWPVKVRDGREGEIIRCTGCLEACRGNLVKGEPIGCTQNPLTGHEYEQAAEWAPF